jgi:hypothetical protein
MRIRRFTGRFGLSAISALMIACGGGGDAGGGGGDAPPAGGGGDAGMASPVDAATAGNVSGRVVFTGMAPEAMAIDMGTEPTCAAKYPNGAMSEEVVVGGDGGLDNVFIYVKEGLDGVQFPTPASEVVMDQSGCRYIPRVTGVQTDQGLVFRNSDGLAHNVNVAQGANRGFNLNQPVSMDSPARTFATPEVMIPVRCDVHGWMHGFVGVIAHPYFAVSANGGSFNLNTLPPGDYVIEAWHERYGVQTQNVTVATGQTAAVEFTFSEEMAIGAVVPLGEPLIIHHMGHDGL